MRPLPFPLFYVLEPGLPLFGERRGAKKEGEVEEKHKFNPYRCTK